MKAKRFSEPSHYFKCNYCSQDFTLESFRVAVILYGIIFLVSKNFGYVGIVCPNCLKTTVEKNEKQQIINVKKELGERIGLLNVRRDKLQNKILITIEAIKNTTMELAASFHCDLKYSTFGQKSNDKIIQRYNAFNRGDSIPHESSPILKSSDYAMTMTHDEINSASLNDNIFISYIANSKIFEDYIVFFGLEEKNINDLVSLENDSQKKVFPRYLYANSTLESCEKFRKVPPEVTNDYLHNIRNPIKRSLQKHKDLLNIFEIVSNDDKNSNLDFLDANIQVPTIC